MACNFLSHGSLILIIVIIIEHTVDDDDNDNDHRIHILHHNVAA